MIEAGRPVADIVGRLEEIRSRMNIFLTLDNLKYAQMSGRVTRLQGALASLLNVKPIIALQGGTLDMTERVRSRTRAIERLLDLTEEAVGQAPVNLAVIHAGAPREAETLMAQAKQRLNCRHVFTHDLAISVAVHLGPGTLGLVSYKV
jgi:DegV family protein with EDD domain